MTATIKLKGSWPTWMDQTEARICNKLITAILRDGYSIRVRYWEDDGDILQDTTQDRAAIQRETAATGATIYEVMQDTRFREGQPLQESNWVPVARILLIHGNGEDVISDASWHHQAPEVEALVDKWCNHATA